MRILAIVSGEYGLRHVENIRRHGPPHWTVETWRAPAVFPLVMDYPEDYLPASLPAADLILHFGEHKGIAELIPDMAKMTGARAVLAPVDNESWLPRGLARQLRGWLEAMNVVCATPKPLCSLTETDYGVTRRQRIAYQDALIAEFAHYFGQPDLELEVDAETRLITSARVKRDAVCGCACYVAERLVGISADDAETQAGLLHHHFPCLASMGKDPDFGDTLMHVSGNVLKDNVGEQVKPFKRVQYIEPGSRSETT
jgi:thymidylate synthase